MAAIWREIVTPSVAVESAYMVMLIGIGHAMLGAAVSPFLAIPRAAVPVIYWAVKERMDLRRGGSVRDGVMDAAFVAIGAAYGASWWPAAVLAAAVSAAVLRG